MLSTGKGTKPIVGEHWTSQQRRGSPIHEISYRACFKPQVPRYFIDRYSEPGDVVYDPFMGRGTTVVEAVLAGRGAIGNDVNPLCAILVEPRLAIPDLDAVEARLESISARAAMGPEIDLSMFFHPQTLREILVLRAYLEQRRSAGNEDRVDRWIRMVATNRLTGHSPGFFSVYTLPPNQAASQEDQKRINRVRRQAPAYRNVAQLIGRKSRRILQALSQDDRTILTHALDSVVLLTGAASTTGGIRSGSVQLTVTSPPFLDIVDYAKDNWLRCWFNNIDAQTVQKSITRMRKVDDWAAAMEEVFTELHRVTRKGGFVAFEVGEVRKKTIRLDEIVIPIGERVGFTTENVFINRQSFTKTAHIWGVRNNRDGTNTNRVVVFRKKP